MIPASLLGFKNTSISFKLSLFLVNTDMKKQVYIVYVKFLKDKENFRFTQWREKKENGGYWPKRSSFVCVCFCVCASRQVWGGRWEGIPAVGVSSDPHWGTKRCSGADGWQRHPRGASSKVCAYVNIKLHFLTEWQIQLIRWLDWQLKCYVTLVFLLTSLLLKRLLFRFFCIL